MGETSAVTRFPEHAPQYGAEKTYHIAAEWLDGHGEVWDWGAGGWFAQRFFGESPYCTIDGTFMAHRQEPLETISIECDSILMRHILENNPQTWRDILRNAVKSFRKRMVLITFMPFADHEHIAKVEQYETGPLEYARLRKADIVEILGDLLVDDYPVKTTHQEHIFLLERRCAEQ